MSDFNDFCHDVKGMVTHMVEQLDPQEDVLPTVFLSDGGERHVVATMDPSFMDNDLSKNILADQVIPQLVRDQKAIYVAVVTCGWMVVHQNNGISPNSLTSMIPPSKDPDRKEAVCLMFLSKDGQSKGNIWVLNRNANAAPNLEAWRAPGMDESNADDFEFGGRFAEGIQTAWGRK